MATTIPFGAMQDASYLNAADATLMMNIYNAQETQRRIDAEERQIFDNIFHQINFQLSRLILNPLLYVEEQDIRNFIRTTRVTDPNIRINYRRAEGYTLDINISLQTYHTTVTVTNFLNREINSGRDYLLPPIRAVHEEFRPYQAPDISILEERLVQRNPWLRENPYEGDFNDLEVRPARYPIPHPDYPNGDETRNYLRLTVWNRIKKAIDQWLPKGTLSTQFIPGQVEGEIKVAGYTIAWINAVSRRLSRIMLPEGATKKDLNLIRYRLRQIGLRVKATGRHEIIVHQIKPTNKPILERLYYGKVYIIPDYHEISFNKPVEVIKPPTQLALELTDTRNTKKTLDDLFGIGMIDPQKAFYQDFLNTYAMGTVTSNTTNTATMGLTRFTIPYTTR